MKTDPISAAIAYRNALEDIAHAPSLSAAVRIAQKMLAFTFDRPEEGHLRITSGYGYNTKQPFVTFSLANPSESANPTIQMTSEAAREQALTLEETHKRDNAHALAELDRLRARLGIAMEQLGYLGRLVEILRDAAAPAATALFNIAQQPALDPHTRETIQQTLAPLDAALAATKVQE